MTTQTINKIVDEIKKIPDDKLPSLLDYLHFLQWESNDYLSADEELRIEQAELEIKAGKGINWCRLSHYSDFSYPIIPTYFRLSQLKQS